MESATTDKAHAGILHLYRARSRSDFYRRLEIVLGEMLSGGLFSVLVPAEREGLFHIEHSTLLSLPRFDLPVVESASLQRILLAPAAESAMGACAELPWKGRSVPASAVRMLRGPGGPVALLFLHDPLPARGATALDGPFLAQLASAFEHMVEREGLVERFDESNARLQAIREIGNLLGELDLEKLLSRLLGVFTSLTEAQVASVILEGVVAMEVEWGLPRQVLDGLRRKDGDSLIAIARKSRESLIVRRYRGNPEYEEVRDFHVESFLCVPLVSSDKVIGMVNLVNPSFEKGRFATETDRAAMVTLSSLAATAVENAILHKESIEKERIQASLQIARSIQQKMYPVDELRLPGYDISWLTRSCEETGGDYLDFIPVGPGNMGFAVGDVSGHGIGAALLMATGRANLKALLSMRGELEEVMGRLNDLMAEDMDEVKFMTLFLGFLDHERHGLRYASAGHDPPLLYRSGARNIVELAATGLPLGMIPGWRYDEGEEQYLEPGDTILLTTDGVWEARSPSGDRFGKVRLRASLASNAACSAREVIAGILKDLEAHMRGRPHEDDMTLAVIRRVG